MHYFSCGLKLALINELYVFELPYSTFLLQPPAIGTFNTKNLIDMYSQVAYKHLICTEIGQHHIATFNRLVLQRYALLINQQQYYMMEEEKPKDFTTVISKIYGRIVLQQAPAQSPPPTPPHQSPIYQQQRHPQHHPLQQHFFQQPPQQHHFQQPPPQQPRQPPMSASQILLRATQDVFTPPQDMTEQNFEKGMPMMHHPDVKKMKNRQMMPQGRRQGLSLSDWKKKQEERVASVIEQFKNYLNSYANSPPFQLNVEEINNVLVHAAGRVVVLLEPLFKEAKRKLRQRYPAMMNFKSRVLQGSVNLLDQIPSKDDFQEFKSEVDRRVTMLEGYLRNFCQKAMETWNIPIVERRKWRFSQMEKVSRIKNSLVTSGVSFTKFPGYDYDTIKVAQFPKPADFTSYYGFAVTQDNLNGLFDLGWLSSSILSNYTKFLIDYFGFNSDSGRGYILNESEVMSMKNPSSFAETITNFKGIFTNNKKVGAIINKNNNHWLFIGILPKQNVIILYDSIFQKDAYAQYVSCISGFMSWERQKEGMPAQQPRFIQSADNAVRQTNGSDCGICSLINLTEFMLGDCTVSKPAIKFNYDLIRKFRLGLYFFCTYLIKCKQEGKLPLADNLYMSTVGIIENRNTTMDLIDLEPKKGEKA